MKTGRSFILTTRGFKNITGEMAQENFKFIVNGETFTCPRFFAEFISPTISKFHMADSTIDSFTINIPFQGSFSDFLVLSEGEPLEINDSNYQFIKYISKSIQNEELMEFFDKDNPELSIDNVIDRLKSKKYENRSYEKEINFISSHFYEIDENSLLNLEYDDLSLILSNDSIQPQSEDSLFDFICLLFKQDESYFGLFENVEFAYLSNEKIQQFVSIFDKSQIKMNNNVWKAISKRLLIFNKQETHRVYHRKAIKIRYNEKEPLNGVFYFLKNKNKKEIAKHQIINVIPSSCSVRDPKAIIDSNQPEVFQTEDRANQWIAFEFRDMKMKVTSYTLQSYYNGKPNFANPKNWILEGSDDGREWVEMDRHEDCPDLNNKNAIQNYKIKGDFKEFKYIRVKQIGKNWANKDQLTLSKVELFGDLYEN